MPDPITRLNAALEGRYTIERELGEGGMATVYLADDLKHERKVALKVLKPELAALVGAERFLAEIKTTANLQHPHILPLFDSGEADGFLFYVMPYVEGETLQDRIDREKQLPVDEAVSIATAVGNALQTAHEQGIIHRDIKPANILLSRGEPLIADFGIALAVGAAGGSRLTETGLSLGTPYYMSPEQATGDQVVGPSTDTYALGAVLYEMLVGDPPYPGSTAQAVLGQIIAGEPVSAIKHRPSIPANVDGALRCALEKLPADRFRSAKDFVRALAEEHFRYGEAVAGVAASTSLWKGSGMVPSGLALVLALALGWSLLSSGPPASVIRYSLFLSPGEELAGGIVRPRIALSPDGERLLYVGPGDGVENRLWVRQRDELEGTQLFGSEGAQSPFFSPDGTQFGFSRDNDGTLELVVASFSGGAPVTLVDTLVGRDGGSWGSDGFIYYDGLTGGGTRGIMRVQATGGTPEQVTTVDTGRGETDHVWPHILPGAEGLIFTVIRSQNLTDADIGASEVTSGEHEILTRGVVAKYTTSGQLLYVSTEGTLFAAPFNEPGLELTGEAVEVATGLNVRTTGAVDFALSHTGRLAYVTGSLSPRYGELLWVDRSGNRELIDPDWVENFSSLSLSPDDSRLAVTVLLADFSGQAQVVNKPLPRGPAVLLTPSTNQNDRPVWSPDGQSVLFQTNRNGTADIYSRRADGSAVAEPVLTGTANYVSAKYSPDGVWLIYVEDDELYARRSGAEAEPQALGVSPWSGDPGSISPNGRWLAYAAGTSDDPSDVDVYVVPFPNTSAAITRISSEGGFSPIWSHTGGELFYKTLDRELVSVDVLDSPNFLPGDRRVLFTLGDAYIWDAPGVYDISSDDQRFMMIGLRTGGLASELIVVENFFEVLEERVGN